MKKFDKRVKPGTKVLVKNWGWKVVEEIHETRKWVRIVGLVGSFQREDVLKFTNKRTSKIGCTIKRVIDKENKDE